MEEIQQKSMLRFEGYRLDPANALLWRGKQLVKLPPKAFGVLHYLADHPGQLVTKAELFQAIWPATVVTDSALTVCIKELRKALGEDPKSPRYIETVHRRGFRFLPTVTLQPVQSSKFRVPSSKTQHSALSTRHSVFVGRETELSTLHAWWEKAVNGERQIVFVSGEPGIGKTTLLEVFLSKVQSPESQEEKQKSKGKRQRGKIENR